MPILHIVDALGEKDLKGISNSTFFAAIHVATAVAMAVAFNQFFLQQKYYITTKCAWLKSAADDIGDVDADANICRIYIVDALR